MMSILLLTLLSALQAHPVLISRVSLLPVAYVVESYVQNVVAVDVNATLVLHVWLVPVLKSRVKVDEVKLPLAPAIGVFEATVCAPPPVVTVNMSAQSFWDDVQKPVSGDGGQLVAALPSS